MHITEGVLPFSILIIGWILTTIFLYLSIKELRRASDKISLVALFSSLFFVTSLIHVPLGPTSVHLTLNGLIGIILGRLSYLAIFVGLFFQAIFFNFGGLFVLGVNAFNMASPAVLFYYLAKPFLKKNSRILNFIGGFIAGFGSIFLAALLVVLELGITNKDFISVSKLAVEAYIPISFLEGLITGVISFLFKDFIKTLQEEKGEKNYF